MHLHEEAVDANGNGSARQRFGKLPLASRTVSIAAWQLEAVRDIEYNRITKGPHDRQAPEVHYEVVITKGRTPLGNDELPVAC